MDNITVAKPKVTRKGSGRTKGAYSFVVIKMGDLTAKYLDPNQPIVVGRKWAEGQGFQNLVSKPANNTTDSIQGTTPDSKPSITVTELE